MTSEQNKYLEERLAEFEQSLIDNPIIPKPPVVDTQREKVHVRYNVPDSTYNLEETEGQPTRWSDISILMQVKISYKRFFG